MRVWLQTDDLRPIVDFLKIDITKALQVDNQTAKVVGFYDKQLNAGLNEELCQLKDEADIMTGNVRTSQCEFGNFVTDIMKTTTGADCAFVNSGVLRADRVYDANLIFTVKDLLDILPMEDVCCMVQLKGRDLKKCLEHSVSLYPAHEGRFLQVSGLKFTFDPLQPSGSRVKSVIVHNHRLKDDEVYKVATTYYLTRGGDGFHALENILSYLVSDEEGIILPSMVRTYIENLKKESVTDPSGPGSSASLADMRRRAKKTRYLPIVHLPKDERIIIYHEGETLSDTQSVASGTGSMVHRKPMSRTSSILNPIPTSQTMAQIIRADSMRQPKKTKATPADSLFQRQSSMQMIDADLESDSGSDSELMAPISPIDIDKVSPRRAQALHPACLWYSKTSGLNVFEAAFQGDLNSVMEFLQDGHNPNILGSGESGLGREMWERHSRGHKHLGLWKSNATPLHYAIASGKPEVVKLLLENGAHTLLLAEVGADAYELAFANLAMAASRGDGNRRRVYEQIRRILHDHKCGALMSSPPRPCDATPECYVSRPPPHPRSSKKLANAGLIRAPAKFPVFDRSSLA